MSRVVSCCVWSSPHLELHLCRRLERRGRCGARKSYGKERGHALRHLSERSPLHFYLLCILVLTEVKLYKVRPD
jgi:hypothetical protein